MGLLVAYTICRRLSTRIRKPLLWSVYALLTKSTLRSVFGGLRRIEEIFVFNNVSTWDPDWLKFNLSD